MFEQRLCICVFALFFGFVVAACSSAIEPEPGDRHSHGSPAGASGVKTGILSVGGSADSPRGLILLTIDTLRADHLSCYGDGVVDTPNIDRLAAAGQLFSRAIAQSTTTTPSHASILTGLYLQDHGVYSNFEALSDGPTTLAEVLQDAGFATFAAVNLRHLNPEISNLGQGFDEFVRSAEIDRAADTVDRMLSWLDELPPGRRFFAWLHFADAHTPYTPPPPYDRLYYDDDERVPSRVSLEKVWPLLPDHMSDHPNFRRWLAGVTDLGWVFAQYRGAVSYIDAQIGRLSTALRTRNLIGDVGMILTADHGESLGEHGMYFVHTGLYEPTARVPLVTYLPGTRRAGVLVDEVVELVSVMPTALDYLGIDFDTDGIRGASLLPAIKGQPSANVIAFTEHAGGNQIALRSARYKYVSHLRTRDLQPTYPFKAGREELYDLRNDPREQRDIAKVKHEITSEFRQEWRRRRRSRLGLDSTSPPLERQTVELLRSLGYVR